MSIVVAAVLMLLAPAPTRYRSFSWERWRAERDARLAIAIFHETPDPWRTTHCGLGPAYRHGIRGRRELVLARVDLALDDIDGCFDDWAFGEANLMLTVAVARDGRAHATTEEYLESPLPSSCVKEAIERVRFPAGGTELDMEVHVLWLEGQLVLAPVITAER